MSKVKFIEMPACPDDLVYRLHRDNWIGGPSEFGPCNTGKPLEQVFDKCVKCKAHYPKGKLLSCAKGGKCRAK